MLEHSSPKPTFAEFFKTWLKIGCINFGGPAGQIAMMHRVIVDEKKWIDEPRFLHALNFSMLTPGPEAQKLATYIGWLLYGVRGGLTAGILFVLPGALVMLGFLLARAGVPVIVLEKHKDFLRDFRGDTVHPSTLELMYELQGALDQDRMTLVAPKLYFTGGLVMLDLCIARGM